MSVDVGTKTPSRFQLSDEFVTKPDVQRWAAFPGENLPEF